MAAAARGLGFFGASLSVGLMMPLHSSLTLWNQPCLPRAQLLHSMNWSASLSARRPNTDPCVRARSEDMCISGNA
jgi:hypothetical protein